ncbi:MAG: hypothetical protein ABI615_07805 [Chthoniobacterales bacterium]
MEKTANLTRGVLYVATGLRFIAEATQSAQSAKRHMPQTPICLYCDTPPDAPHPFDEIRVLKNPRHFFVDKVEPLLESPFERTLFLDTDTLVCQPLDDLFQILDRFDMALAHAPLRHDRPFVVPNCFVELNTGVIAYRRCKETADLIRRWSTLYEDEVQRSGKVSDQESFRQAAYESEARIYILPSEYNLRSVMPAITGRCAVRVIHGRAENMEALAEKINASRKIRTLLPSLRDLDPDHFVILSPAGHILRCLTKPIFALLHFLERLKRSVSGGSR